MSTRAIGVAYAHALNTITLVAAAIMILGAIATSFLHGDSSHILASII